MTAAPAVQPTAQPTTAAEEPLVLRDLSDSGVLTLTLNRPRAFNALSEALLDALTAVRNSRSTVSNVVGCKCTGKKRRGAVPIANSAAIAER